MKQRIQYPDTVDGMYKHLLARLEGTVPKFELRQKAELALQVNQLKREKRALILGHNYMEPALFHSVPDHTGDSLELSRIAASAECEIIVFCGVRFMAETAKILSPHRTVLLPSAKGGCSLAESITGDDVRALKQLYPEVPVVTYVNTYADVKAESDYCCTSSNGAAVVKHLQEQGHERIIFLPDEYLASNVARDAELEIIFPEMGARSPREEGAEPRRGQARERQQETDPPNLTRYMVGWRGRCEVHEKFTVEDIENVRKQFPDAVVLSHPECSPEVVAASDFSGSTTAMIRHVEQMEAGRYLLLTECAMGDNIASKNPQREMLRLCSVRCPHMNEITLEETVAALQKRRHEIDVPAETAKRARRALERMIAIG